MSLPPGNIGILKSGIISQKIKKDWKNFFCVKYIPKWTWDKVPQKIIMRKQIKQNKVVLSKNEDLRKEFIILIKLFLIRWLNCVYFFTHFSKVRYVCIAIIYNVIL